MPVECRVVAIPTDDVRQIAAEADSVAVLVWLNVETYLHKEDTAL